jgi:hypothetical protein
MPLRSLRAVFGWCLRGRPVPHPVEGTGAVFEAKFMLPWNFSEGAAEKHMAQLQHDRVKDGGAVDHHRRRNLRAQPLFQGAASARRAGHCSKERPCAIPSSFATLVSFEPLQRLVSRFIAETSEKNRL